MWARLSVAMSCRRGGGVGLLDRRDVILAPLPY